MFAGRLDPTPAPRPEPTTIEGRYVRLVPLDADAHAEALWEQVQGHDALWAYLFDGPFFDRDSFYANLMKKSASPTDVFFAIVDRESAQARGFASLMRIEPAHRCIEVGSILYTPVLQRTRGATEAMYLLARHVFEELGYRRYEWKCNALNEPSRRAALRLGFSFEGVFRQHMIIKGRNRDTAWFSMLDCEWEQRKAMFERWLDPANFDEAGRQKSSLESPRNGH
jgi:RimJ/RimL family protein N-acetyltransferase